MSCNCSHTHLFVHGHACSYYYIFGELQVWLLFEGSYYSGCSFYSSKYGRLNWQYLVTVLFFILLAQRLHPALCTDYRYTLGIEEFLPKIAVNRPSYAVSTVCLALYTPRLCLWVMQNNASCIHCMNNITTHYLHAIQHVISEVSKNTIPNNDSLSLSLSLFPPPSLL